MLRSQFVLPSAQSSSCFQCTLFPPTFYYENLNYPGNWRESPGNDPWGIFVSYCPSPAWLLYSYPLLQATFFKRLVMGNLRHGKSVLRGSSRWSPGHPPSEGRRAWVTVIHRSGFWSQPFHLPAMWTWMCYCTALSLSLPSIYDEQRAHPMNLCWAFIRLQEPFHVTSASSNAQVASWEGP